MSQRGNVGHSASRGSSRSPPRDDEQGSPAKIQRRDFTGRLPHQELPAGGSPPSRSPSTSIGVQNILNPPEQGSLPRQRPIYASPDLGGRPYAQVPPPGYGSHPGTPAPGLSSIERRSPSSVQPLPALNNPRKILSPKSARAGSISRSSVPREFDPRAPSFAGPSLSMKRPFEPEIKEERRSPLPNLSQAHSRSALTSAQSRSLSQPLVRPPSIPPVHGPPPPPAHRGAHPGPSPLMVSRTVQPQQLPGHRSFTMAGPPGEGSLPWAQTMGRSGSTMGSALGAGEEAYMTLPGSDVPIPVQVDYSQASKKADEKRQRNAKASTRHRKKKKTLQEESIRQLEELREEHQRLANAMELVKAQRDHYRAERNRLRDIVVAQQAISDQAAGPPTPTSVRTHGSFADVSPTGHTPQLATPSQGYASEASSTMERPSQRRRTEDRPEFSVPVYDMPTGSSSASLPSIQGQSYSVPPRPPSASSAGSMDRLPPLRDMEGSSAPTQGLGSGTHEQDPRTGQWVPVQARHYDAGWATGRGNPGDGKRR